MEFGNIADQLKKIIFCLKNNRLVNIENEGITKQSHNSNQGDVVAGNKIVNNNTVTIPHPAVLVKLSPQAEKLLRAFVESKAKIMGFITLYETGTDLHLMFDGRHSKLDFDQRFIRDNLKQLEAAGYIVNANGNDAYNLTESALEYINDMSKNDLSETARGMLQQLIASGVNECSVVTTNMCNYIGPIKWDGDCRSVLYELEKRDLIKWTNPKHFFITKEAKDYMKDFVE